jgi:hypothetical protein
MFGRENPWDQLRAPAATMAENPALFIEQHIQPLLINKTLPDSRTVRDQDIYSEEQFWHGSGIPFGVINLPGFTITDWFPRAPGVFWTEMAEQARAAIYATEPKYDRDLGTYYEPRSKLGLVEYGGIGSIRLRPRRIDGVYCWLGTALTSECCHKGIPLAIPESLLDQSGFQWGETANLTGRVRFLHEAGLDDVARTVRGTRPVIVFVESLVPQKPREPLSEGFTISPVVLFESRESSDVSYTFLEVYPTNPLIAGVADWVSAYATKYNGRVITNFDEQCPQLSDAPLSYQRLVTKTYDRTVIHKYAGDVVIQRIDNFTMTTEHYGDTHVGDNINVTGTSGVVAIHSTLTNVTQTINSSPGLDSAQKKQLEEMVQSLKTELDALRASHPDEVKEIDEAVQKTISLVAKPAAERKSSLLQLSAKGLTEAAELLKDIAPTVLATASMIANFVVGLK